MKLRDCILKILQTASLIVGLPIVAFVFFCEAFGYDRGTALLNSIRFPLSDNELIVVGYICAGIFIGSLLYKKLISK